jgi:mannose/cellobiose epimerase-like protein (N-acyl-D-glucosamine 2-epimerase family)
MSAGAAGAADPPAVPAAGEFRSETFLRSHIARTMAFYHPRAIDPRGGFFHYFRDDGTVYDAAHRHLVSSTRFVFNYAMAAREFAGDARLRAEYLDAARHGLAYLRERHRDARSGGYAWTIRDGAPEDRTQHAYGAAFVLLAYATAASAGIEEARAWLDETWLLLESRYWDASFGLYRDEADPDWRFSGYRGQNSNMHLCEALLAAHAATHDARYLARALTLADHMTRRQAARAGGLVWEHYDREWNVDWDYHRDDPRHLFRPWGFQPGHQTEWAKLLLTLDERLRPDEPQRRGAPPRPAAGANDWLLPRAQQLFDTAVARAWDEQYGGLCYGFAPDGRVCDDDKYFWVQAESIAAAARLALRSGDPRYWEWYERLWTYAWRHFVDHRYGAWYRILDRANRRYSDEKSPAGKTDYHTMGACHDVLQVLRHAA